MTIELLFSAPGRAAPFVESTDGRVWLAALGKRRRNKKPDRTGWEA
jgi:hypothetical protein